MTGILVLLELHDLSLDRDVDLGDLGQGRYIVWLEVQHRYGPLGMLGYDEAVLIRNYG